MPQTDLCHEFLKASAIDGGRSRLPQIAVDYHNLFFWPAQRHCPLSQRILARGALLFSYTCRGVDCLTYGWAFRFRCAALTFCAASFMLVSLPAHCEKPSPSADRKSGVEGKRDKVGGS